MTKSYRRLMAAIHRHGFGRTAAMAWRLVCRSAAQVWPNTKVMWARICAKDGCVTRVVEGSKMVLDLRDAGISKELFLSGVHEPHSTPDFKAELLPEMVLLEIGANVGYYALIAATVLHPRGRIIALEPSPHNVRLLETNASLNGVEDVFDVHQVAAGREPGKLPFYVVSKSNLCGFVNREGQGIRLIDTLDVPVVTVDDMLAELGRTIDYFRMDVEGFEFEVVRGMEKTLSGEAAPAGGFIEVHSEILNRRGSSGRAFVEHIRGLGYEIKMARYRGRADTAVASNLDFLEHPLCETGYWEAFFRRVRNGRPDA